MRKSPRLIFFLALVVTSLFLSACTGQAAVSWPGISTSPDNQSAYVAFAQHVYQVNLANGTESWRFPVEPEGKMAFYAPPGVSDDGTLLLGGYDWVFYSVKPGSAQPNWTFREAKDHYIGSSLSMGDLVYAPSSDGRLFALRLQDGSKAWEFGTKHSLWSPPVSDGELLYQASLDHYIYALKPDTGEKVWTSEDLGGQIVASPTLSEDGRLYTATFGSKTDDPVLTSQFIALDAATGKKLWNQPIRGWVWASPLLVEDTLYFGDTAGYFYAMDAQTGSPRWKYPQSGEPKAKTSILGGAAVVGDKVYFGSEAGVITILNRADGTTPQEIALGGQIYSGLIVVDDMILFAPNNYDEAILVALNPDGAIKWKFLPAKK